MMALLAQGDDTSTPDDERRREKSGDADFSTESSDSILKAARKFSSKMKKPGTSKCFNCGQIGHLA